MTGAGVAFDIAPDGTLTATAQGGVSAVLGGAANRLWNVGDTVCRPDILQAIGGAATCASGQIYWMGGPGMIVRKGLTVRGIEWVSNGAAVTPTHQWFVLGMPDPTGLATVTVLATSKDDLTAAWGANVAKKLSLAVADGGSGIWTAQADTPVYAGIVQVAGTPSTIKGIAVSAANDTGNPLWWGSGPAALTVPSDLAGVTAIAATSIMPASCRLSASTT